MDAAGETMSNLALINNHLDGHRFMDDTTAEGLTWAGFGLSIAGGILAAVSSARPGISKPADDERTSFIFHGAMPQDPAIQSNLMKTKAEFANGRYKSVTSEENKAAISALGMQDASRDAQILDRGVSTTNGSRVKRMVGFEPQVTMVDSEGNETIIQVGQSVGGSKTRTKMAKDGKRVHAPPYKNLEYTGEDLVDHEQGKAIFNAGANTHYQRSYANTDTTGIQTNV